MLVVNLLIPVEQMDFQYQTAGLKHRAHAKACHALDQPAAYFHLHSVDTIGRHKNAPRVNIGSGKAELPAPFIAVADDAGDAVRPAHEGGDVFHLAVCEEAADTRGGTTL